MSMKKILMAAVAVSALSAGAASAATLSNGSTVGSISLASGTTYDAYTIANELVTDATSNVAGSLTFTPTANAISSGTYLVTWTISGGTFDVASAYTYSGTAAGAGTNTGSASTKTATKIVASYTVAGTATGFTLGGPILVGTSKSPVVISGSITNTDGTPIDGGDIAAVTVLDYRAGLKFVATTTGNGDTLTIGSGFKDFTTSTTYAKLATAVGFQLNDKPDATVTAADKVWFNTTGTAAAVSTLVSGAKLTVGGTLSQFNLFVADVAALTNKQAADATTTSVVTADANTLAGLVAVTPTAVIGLDQKGTPLVGTESTYAVAPTVTMASAAYSTPTFSSKALGSITYAGTSYYAPWVGDGSNGISQTIRVTNPSATTAIAAVKVTIANTLTKGTSGTVSQSSSCDMGTVPAAGELLITTAKLAACFGSFGRGDVTVTVNGNMGATAAAGGTVKMRTVSVNGTVSDVPMGKGATSAIAQ